MLLADFGPPLSGNRELPVWEEAVRLFAQIQVDAAARVDDLVAIGCLDRRLSTLPAQVAALADDAEALVDLTVAERDQLRALAPRVGGLCDALADHGVPPSLVHGDLHPGNIAVQGERLIYFDWTDGCVAHPFFDLITVLDGADRLPEPPAEVRARLRDAYLAPWTAYAPAERLIAAYTLAMPLAALHQAVSYRHIVNGVEAAARAEWHGVAYWVRQALTLVPDDAGS
jgi:aminoglycoside phosphotransferase (APT) family kinase protein